MTKPAEVGDLDADAVVLRFAHSDVVHLPAGRGDCPALGREIDECEERKKRAATLWDDTPICRYCRGLVEVVGNPAGNETLPTTTEVRAE